MKIYAIGALVLLLSACTSIPKSPTEPSILEQAPPTESVLQSRLGMIRPASDLGFQEKSFDPCLFGVSRQCGAKFLSVIHFQLLCRDSEGTVSEVPLSLRPINSPKITWQVGPRSGTTQTDIEGFGQVALVNDGSVRNKRLILRMGKQFVGVTASEINKLVLPQNWCT